MGVFGHGSKVTVGDKTFDVWGWYGDDVPCDLIPIAPNIAIQPNYHITAADSREIEKVDISMCYTKTTQQVVIKSCTFTGSTILADGLKVRDINKFPIESIIREFTPDVYGYDTDQYFGPLLPWNEVIANVPLKKMGEKGPTQEVLRWVARVYYMQHINRIPPTKTIAEVFGIPQRTASHWVKLMRERVRKPYFDILHVENMAPSTINILICAPDDATKMFYNVVGLES